MYIVKYIYGVAEGMKYVPTINSFIVRVSGKCEIEKYICDKNKSLQKLIDKWTL